MYLPDAKKIYQGSVPVEKIMLGNTQVWPYKNPFEIPDYVTGNTVAFKRLDGEGSAITLYNCYVDENGVGRLDINLFSDYNGNDLVPTNAVIETTGYLKTYTLNFDSNGWAVFRFERPVHTIACAIVPSPSYPVTVFPVIPSTVKILAGLFGLGSHPGIVENRYYIPEGVEVLSGNCVFMTDQFNNGSVYIPSTVQTIGVCSVPSETGEPRNALYRWYKTGPKLFYFNGTYDEYNAIDWQGRIEYYYSLTGETGYAGYPVKCTDGVFYHPKSYGGL